MRTDWATKILLAMVLAALLAVLLRPEPVPLQAAPTPPAKFAGVLPFTTVGGLMGLFDTRDGRLYFYESNLDKCTYVTQVDRLGDPMKKLRWP